MMEGTYKVEKTTDAPYLWMPGNHQGWAPSQAPTLYKPEGNKAYWGMSELNGGLNLPHSPIGRMVRMADLIMDMTILPRKKV